jgi:hypothetical protein
MPDKDQLNDPRSRGRAPARIDRYSRRHVKIPAMESSEGPAQAGMSGWGGPRALNGRGSNEAGSLDTNDHRNNSTNEVGAKMSAKTGTTFQSIFLAAVIVAIGALLLGGEPFSKAELRVDPPSPSPARVDGLMQRQNGAAMMKTKPAPMTR